MKGIVADVKGRYAVILRKDGSFVKVRNNGTYRVGYETDFKEPASVNRRMIARVSSIAAGAILAIGVSCAAYSYTLPYSVVDMDINPSIEITANIYDRIIKTEALNADGKKLLADTGLEHSSLDEGIAAIMNNAVAQGYLKEETPENAVVFTVVSKDEKKSDELGQGIEAAAKNKLNEAGVKSDMVVEKASKQEHDSAKGKGLTQGKLNLIEKAIEAEPDLKVDDLKDAPVKDIMKKIKKNDSQTVQEASAKQDDKTSPQTTNDDQSAETAQNDEASALTGYTWPSFNWSSFDWQWNIPDDQNNQNTQAGQNTQKNQSSQNNQNGQNDRNGKNSNSRRDQQGRSTPGGWQGYDWPGSASSGSGGQGHNRPGSATGSQDGKDTQSGQNKKSGKNTQSSQGNQGGKNTQNSQGSRSGKNTQNGQNNKNEKNGKNNQNQQSQPGGTTPDTGAPGQGSGWPDSNIPGYGWPDFTMPRNGEQGSNFPGSGTPGYSRPGLTHPGSTAGDRDNRNGRTDQNKKDTGRDTKKSKTK